MSITVQAQKILIDANTIPEAFWDMVDHYRTELINQANAILTNRSDAEEVVQETMYDAYRQREKLAESPSLGASLKTINRANALDRLRKKIGESGKIAGKKSTFGPKRATTGGITILETRDALIQAIEKLPDQMRDVMILRFWDHLTYEEIGRRINMPARTVCLVFHDAAQRLYRILEPQLEK